MKHSEAQANLSEAAKQIGKESVLREIQARAYSNRCGEAARLGVVKPGEYFVGVYGNEDYLVSLEGVIVSLGSMKRLKFHQSKASGYLTCGINTSGGIVTRTVHTVVLESFVGPRPHPSYQGCHNNGVRTDNRLANLRWDSPASNNADKVSHGTANFGERNPMARLTKDDVLMIRESSESQHALAKRFGVAPMTINRIVRGHTWKLQ